MCSFVPFVNTATIMASSLLLVAIAMDRYMAIRRAVSKMWNPDLRFCVLALGGIWLMSLLCALPLFFISDTKYVYLQLTDELILDELQLATVCLGMQVSGMGKGEDQYAGRSMRNISSLFPLSEEHLLKTAYWAQHVVDMCYALSYQPNNLHFYFYSGDTHTHTNKNAYLHPHVQGIIGVYNVIVLGLIFLPCIVAFVFLNATIARQLWRRRHQQQQQHLQAHKSEPRFVHLVNQPETTYAMMTAFSVAASLEKLPLSQTLTQAPPKALSAAAAARVARHRRMVRVVIMMMAAFICLRLPAWIFLLMRLYGSFSSPVDWLLYFVFGLLNLTSSALNPLFYTFLTQTIRVLSQLKQQLGQLLCCHSKHDGDVAMPQESVETPQRWPWRGLRITWRCQPKSDEEPCETAETFPDLEPRGNIYTIPKRTSLAPRIASIESSD